MSLPPYPHESHDLNDQSENGQNMPRGLLKHLFLHYTNTLMVFWLHSDNKLTEKAYRSPQRLKKVYSMMIFFVSVVKSEIMSEEKSSRKGNPSSLSKHEHALFLCITYFCFTITTHSNLNWNYDQIVDSIPTTNIFIPGCCFYNVRYCSYM